MTEPLSIPALRRMLRRGSARWFLPIARFPRRLLAYRLPRRGYISHSGRFLSSRLFCFSVISWFSFIRRCLIGVFSSSHFLSLSRARPGLRVVLVAVEIYSRGTRLPRARALGGRRWQTSWISSVFFPFVIPFLYPRYLDPSLVTSSSSSASDRVCRSFERGTKDS